MRVFQSTLPVRGATGTYNAQYNRFFISIHAPRAGSDRLGRYPEDAAIEISIHAPRAGSDHDHLCVGAEYVGFQSTLPVRGATHAAMSLYHLIKFQSTLPVRGATPAFLLASTSSEFQSTLPVRGATIQRGGHGDMPSISIHAPRAGSDDRDRRVHGEVGISIHAPRAGSDHAALATDHKLGISIHAPRAGSDIDLHDFGIRHEISIHAPRAGSDPCDMPKSRPSGAFQSTLPVRGATSARCANPAGTAYFNPRSPCGERLCFRRTGYSVSVFQSTLPVRGATWRPSRTISARWNFNPRSPCGERPCWLMAGA